ncbi:MAG: Unknown protein [uncultured Sulfurovum sp.]|uniref:Uncharacterized protein n=1 Tax=uncultured Sulfurovum sp. TaxID=269237 RepID=A0A6S6TWY3_9BACT|nr:MAG: Unknown protein [uncultured Sulfurovum sp.]
MKPLVEKEVLCDAKKILLVQEKETRGFKIKIYRSL